MSNSRQRRDGERRPSDRGPRRDRDDRDDRRDSQPDDEHQRRPIDVDMQESDSLTALKAILGKVAGLLTTLKLNQDECISLVEQLYGSVLDMDLKLAGETDDKRKVSILAHIQNTQVTRSGAQLVVEFPKMETPKEAASSLDTQAKGQADAPETAEVTEKAETPAPKPAPTSPRPRPTPEPPAEPKSAPAIAPTAEPAAEPTPDPAAQPNPEPAPESASEPVADSDQVGV